MTTSVEWLQSIKQQPAKFTHWLSQQWLAELEAAKRIHELASKSPSYKDQMVLRKIAQDESKHAELLRVLCERRGIACAAESTGRYYSQIELDKLSTDELYAAGHYAEGMRLSRIEAIVQDADMPQDIRETFTVILKDEQMHEAAFGALASEEALRNMQPRHEMGMQALGLTV